MTREDWLKGFEIRKQLREGRFIIEKLCSKRTVAVDYNWLEQVSYDAFTNPFSIEDYVEQMNKLLWAMVPDSTKTLTIKYMCYTGDNRYYLESKEKLTR
jgi:hypothetical protein